MTEIPSVEVFKNITPVNAGEGDEVFAYKGSVDAAVWLYMESHDDRMDAFWDSEQGTLDETRKARQLAMEYLLRTSQRAVNVPDGPLSNLWADRFTQASIELYGEPSVEVAAGLFSEELTDLLSLRGDERISQYYLELLIGTYSEVLENVPPETVELVNKGEAERNRELAAIQAYGEAIREKYQGLFDLVDQYEQAEFSPEDLRDLFEKALDWMTENDDPDWSEWRAVMNENKTQVSTSSEHRLIKVGDKRVPASHSMARKLLAHELLVHALRGKNAYQSGDDMLLKGLPGFLDAEEGQGVLSEQAVEGGNEIQGRDRYMDIALALGTVDGQQRNRDQVQQIVFARKLVAAQHEGTFKLLDDVAVLARSALGSVDRIYRGGKGDSVNERQAVYTKDLSYYNGYVKMAEYIREKIESGWSPAELFDYVSRGSFDPTNSKHTARPSLQ